MSLRKGVDAFRGAGIFHWELLLRVLLAAFEKCDRGNKLMREGREVGWWIVLSGGGDEGKRN